MLDYTISESAIGIQLATNHFTILASSERADWMELATGFAAIMVTLWLPTHEQLVFGPIALLSLLAVVLWKHPTLEELGLGSSGLLSSFWILPAAILLTIVGVVVARRVGTYHALYNPGFAHVWGYVAWTLYQQFLLQDFFMPRLTRLLTSNRAIAAAAVLFSVAHLPNLPLTLATLAWGAVSCLLFRRYRSLYVLGLAQGILGLCFAVCVPDAMVHHMRVGLGYLHYHGVRPGHYVNYPPTSGR
jgi:hypothetical protein